MDYFNNEPVEEAKDTIPVVQETPVVEAPVDHVIETPVVEEVKAEEPAPVHVEESPVVEPQNDAISAPSYPAPVETQVLGTVNGAIGTATTQRNSKPESTKKATKEKKETVALLSTKNVTWEGVGKVYRGYNIVDKDAADKWLTRSHIRIATPEEVAKEFGK